ncbi:SPFH domain-containing protein [Streptomyces sp. NPDC048255]|uniref:SPFH domain-containing protein n=1 Tax=Streptomyces sp. NPDC048255 TaxID=3154713 RepID=UPI0033D6BE0D
MTHAAPGMAPSLGRASASAPASSAARAASDPASERSPARASAPGWAAADAAPAPAPGAARAASGPESSPARTAPASGSSATHAGPAAVRLAEPEPESRPDAGSEPAAVAVAAPGEGPEPSPRGYEVPAARTQADPHPSPAAAAEAPQAQAQAPRPRGTGGDAAVPHPYPDPAAAEAPHSQDQAAAPRPRGTGGDAAVPHLYPDPAAAEVLHPQGQAAPRPRGTGGDAAVPHLYPDPAAAEAPHPQGQAAPRPRGTGGDAVIPHPYPDPAAAEAPHPQDQAAPRPRGTGGDAATPHPHPHPDPAAAEAPHPQDQAAAPRPRATGGDAVIPHPQAPAAEPSGVPGPGVVEIVAQAVARGLEPDGADTQDLPRTAPHRGAAVTEVPVHLPFRAEPRQPATPAAGEPRPAANPRSAAGNTPAANAPARRTPRGDDRLRERYGPVLPGWIGVAVGGLALTGCAAVLWRAGAVPATLVAAFGATPRAYHGLRATHWPPLAFLGIVALLALGGLGRSRTGHAWVLTLFGRYRGTVRRTGLTWISPLLLRTRVDVRLRHWRSDPMPAVDSGGLALQVVVQVVWQVKDTARATLAVADHTEYLAEQVESAMARVLSQLPADAFHEDAPTLRDAEAVGDALTRMLAAETEAVGVEVYSAQPTRIEYAPEVAAAMRRRRVAAIDAKHRDSVLTSVVDAVDDTVHRLTSRGLVELDDYERKALVKDLTVAFYTGRSE